MDSKDQKEVLMLALRYGGFAVMTTAILYFGDASPSEVMSFLGFAAGVLFPVSHTIDTLAGGK